ncbi:hypothetical protein P7C71_g5041, partial [Lecanoromycetidae sp. Uapishka_2]
PSDSEDFFSPDPRNRDPSLPPAPPSDRSDAAINLSVLQRYLPSAGLIVDKAPYAVVYVFEKKDERWEKTGVEGSVFILQLASEGGRDEYAVMVLNRRGLDNWVLHLKSSEGVQLTEEYIILQGTGDEEEKVYGLWIFEEADKSTRGLRELFGNSIVECARKAQENGLHGETIQDGQLHGPENESNGHVQNPMLPSSSPDLMAILNPSRTQVPQQPDVNQGVDILNRFFRNDGSKAA